MAEIIDGKKIAGEIRDEVRRDIAILQDRYKEQPGLAVILVGDDPASSVYVRMKSRDCEEVGIRSFQYNLDAATTEKELLALVQSLNTKKEVNGILVQLPLPGPINEKKILNSIDPAKDVDGFHPVNVGKIMIGDEDCFRPCTPAGCQLMINRFVQDLKGKHVVVVGRSNIVGKPLANMMLQKNDRANCIVTVCHTAADDIGIYTKQADILVVAAGRPNTVNADMVKDGVVVIDVGTNRIQDPHDSTRTKLVGDVDFEGVKHKASAITPVPGGVGPMTRAMLLVNTLRAFKMQNSISV